jgi:hypothetical protein
MYKQQRFSHAGFHIMYAAAFLLHSALVYIMRFALVLLVHRIVRIEACRVLRLCGCVAFLLGLQLNACCAVYAYLPRKNYVHIFSAVFGVDKLLYL